MKNKLNLNYFTPQTARGYQFVTIPTLLITHGAFDPIDYGTKLLYGMMLNRASLSAVNSDSFTDRLGRLYIIYTVEQVMADLRCSKKTAVKMLQQLDDIGLIEKKRQGQGKPTLIFIKDFASVDFTAHFQKCKSCTSEGVKVALQEVQEVHCSKKDYSKTDYKSINQSGKPKIDAVYSPKKKKRKNQKEIDGLIEQEQNHLKNKCGECSYVDAETYATSCSTDNTTYSIEIKYANSLDNAKRIDITETSTLTTQAVATTTQAFIERGTVGAKKTAEETKANIVAQVIKEYEECDELVKLNIQYDYLIDHTSYSDDIVEEITELMVETICSKKDTVRVGGEEKPHAVVASRLKKLDFTHIEYVLDCLRDNTSKIHNIRAYLLTTLYNSFTSLSNYYQQRVNYDFSEGVI